MTNRSSLSFIGIIAFLAWAGLLLFTGFVPPHTLLAFVVFFLILSLALMSTFTPITYLLGHLLLTRRHLVTMRYALRQAALLAIVILLNLILRALHSWNIFTALVILASAIIIEILTLARK